MASSRIIRSITAPLLLVRPKAPIMFLDQVVYFVAGALWALTFAVLGSMLSGCNLAPIGEVEAGPEVGVTAVPELLDPCERGIARWEAATGIQMACDEGRPMRFGTPADVCAAASTRYDRVQIRAQETGLCDPEADGTPHDTLPDTAEQLATSVAHELGHVLKGSSGHAPSGLMSAHGAGGDLITAETLAWVCETAACTVFRPESE